MAVVLRSGCGRYSPGMRLGLFSAARCSGRERTLCSRLLSRILCGSGTDLSSERGAEHAMRESKEVLAAAAAGAVARPAGISLVTGERSMQQPKSRRVITRDQYDAVLLDLDGVITDTANLHAACWKQMFDEYLQKRATQSGEAFRPFDLATDYRLHVDGKPRFDGVRDFLKSRGIQLP